MGRLFRSEGNSSAAEELGSSVAEAHRPTEPGGAVCVDVDESLGALLLRSTPEREGLEVEIHPADDPAARTHVWVLPRAVGNSVTYAALFPSLAAGPYRVLEPDGVRGSDVVVVPARVTTVDWK
ncbi:MAG: hypothetical protein ACYCSF_07265 [Acidimicrobiales bacterium]